MGCGSSKSAVQVEVEDKISEVISQESKSAGSKTEVSKAEVIIKSPSLGASSGRLDSHHAARAKLRRISKKMIVYLRLYLNSKRKLFLLSIKTDSATEKLPFYGPERHKAARAKLVRLARQVCVYLRLFLNSKKNVRARSISVVFLRHGESEWNAENRFTGWTDVPLSTKGESEAVEAGLLLKGMKFDQIYTSVLQRSIKTFELLKLPNDVPVSNEWRLNERHYGSLQGLNKSETTEKHGEEQVKIWRRSYDIPPPLLKLTSDQHPRNDKKYTEELQVDPSDLPAGGESLKDCVARVLPLWTTVIGPKITEGKSVLIVAHGNSLRALVKHLAGISDEAIADLNIPTGVPLVFVLDKKSLLPAKPFFYLGDAATAKAKADQVAAQASAIKS